VHSRSMASNLVHSDNVGRLSSAHEKKNITNLEVSDCKMDFLSSSTLSKWKNSNLAIFAFRKAHRKIRNESSRDVGRPHTQIPGRLPFTPL
jgi:hypothetical protein